MTKTLRLALLSLVAILALGVHATDVDAQTRVFLRVEIAMSTPTATPAVDLKPFEPPQWPLAERTAIRQMWSGMESQATTIARECQMPVEVAIDATSFRGNIVAGTDDGLHPGTRSRFRDIARALTAVCGRGDMERSAVQQRVRGIQFGFTDNATDALTLDDGTLVFNTNGDMSGRTHLGYSQMIDAIIATL